MPKAKPERKSISQRTRFIKAAREAECSEDEAVVDATLKKIGSYKQGAPMAKEQKTAEELKTLLFKRIVSYHLGREPNPQWVKIIPMANDEGANWEVSHSPETDPPGDFWKAIERAMPELQKLYDLLPEKP